MLNYKSYESYGGTMLDNLGVTRQSIHKLTIENEKLKMNGVRKYEYETGRFNSVDILWEKYRGSSQYQYAGNNHIWANDWDGMKLAYSGNTSNFLNALISTTDTKWLDYFKQGMPKSFNNFFNSAGNLMIDFKDEFLKEFESYGENQLRNQWERQ